MEKIVARSETMSHEELPSIARYFDAYGRIVIWPSKKSIREMLYTYLASLFEENRVYSEKEVNELLTAATSVIDCATLRRDLCDFRYLKRTQDGSQYWRDERSQPSKR